MQCCQRSHCERDHNPESNAITQHLARLATEHSEHRFSHHAVAHSAFGPYPSKRTSAVLNVRHRREHYAARPIDTSLQHVAIGGSGNVRLRNNDVHNRETSQPHNKRNLLPSMRHSDDDDDDYDDDDNDHDADFGGNFTTSSARLTRSSPPPFLIQTPSLT